MGADLAHVAWAVNLGCLGLHLWAFRALDLQHPDELRIDLDPQPGVGFDEARTAALLTRQLLDELGIPASKVEPRYYVDMLAALDEE